MVFYIKSKALVDTACYSMLPHAYSTTADLQERSSCDNLFASVIAILLQLVFGVWITGTTHDRLLKLSQFLTNEKRQFCINTNVFDGIRNIWEYCLLSALNAIQCLWFRNE